LFTDETEEHRLFGFLTTEPNAEVRPIHPKATPVILKTTAEMEAWLTASWSKAAPMQKPLSDGALSVVARNIGADV
jgi:putative SOS response-associated peptidase YedK